MIVNLAELSNVFEGRHTHQGIPVLIYHLPRSPLEAMLILPGQGTRIGTLTNRLWNDDPLSVKGVVVLAVFELFTNASADLEVQIGRHRHIACVKQAVDVAP